MAQRKKLFNEVHEAKSMFCALVYRRMKKSRKPDNSLVDTENVTPRQLNSRVQSLRRSQRLLNAKHISFQPDQTFNRAKSVETMDLDSDFSVEEETGQVVSRKTCVEDKPIETSSGKGGQMTKGVSMREKFKIEALVKGKRKRYENSEATQNGWTEEQEVALRRAYFVAKPTPHFWKKVSKLVPGKSAHDCFERIHQDHLTPPQHQPRSRAKKLNSSPIEEVLLSASKLLKPIVNEARKSSRSKSKSYLTQKSLRRLLQRNQKVGPVHEGDLFSVLEPNVDFPTTAFPPSNALSTPEKLDEKQGWLQSSNEKSSSRQGKALSRSNSSCDSDIVSSPVLKQVKNRVLHEKYINQLRRREARRRAASAGVEMSKLGEAVSKESNVQKGGVVESAKIALVSEAKDAIKKFQNSQANLMDSCNSDEDIDDHVEAESCDDEDESQ
ncbi:hypothetical protein QN277_028527 [Acacia crassicarpa]|uniref:Myb-like domain-containing protein n=1 Tax=Acacia crassicarpa TaxID=499986 RepID=A0AAE1MJV1_9FABA|nr:hypothetical protein QN277_028527 [Acacia crassicarpa]